jgi:hypothetical protein
MAWPQWTGNRRRSSEEAARERGRGMTAKDAFSLSPKQWDEVEEKYRKASHLPAEDMLAELLAGANATQQQYLALGIMVGRASR